MSNELRSPCQVLRSQGLVYLGVERVPLFSGHFYTLHTLYVVVFYKLDHW